METALNHVLIVDTDDRVRAEVRRLLSQAQVAPVLISEANTAEDALLAYQSPRDHRPTIIVMSLDLCGKHGDEWLAQARGAAQLLSTPVVLLVQDDADERLEIALAAGADDCLLLNELTSWRVKRILGSALSRHQLLQASSEAESYYRMLVNSTPAMMWGSDSTKQRVFFNQRWLDFTGRSIEQEVGTGWLDALHPEDRAKSYQLYSQAFDRREPFEMEYRMLRHDGECRCILARGKPRYDSAGLFLGYTGSCIDITERHAIAEESRLNEERLRVVLRGSAITVMTVDRNLRYTWIHNAQGGMTAEQMIGKRDDELFPPEVAIPAIAFKREVLDKEVPLRREMTFALHGLYEQYDTRAEPLRNEDGHVVGITVVAINVTERVRQEERAKLLAEASHLLASSLDYETTLQQVTRSIVPQLADWCSVDIVSENEEIEQVAVEHVDPEKVRWAKSLRALYPPSLDDPRGLAYVLRTGNSEFYPEISQALMDEAIANAPTEELREVVRSVGYKSVIMVPMSTRRQIVGALTLVWSDSDRRYNEADLAFAEELARRAATAVDHARLYRDSLIQAEQFRGLNETLEQLVDERTRELQRSNQDLDQFAYIASHDLKAPLRAIDHLSTWVLEDVGHLLPDRSHEHLEKMRSRIKRMEGLLDDLLTYSRAGRFRGTAETVDTNVLVARVIDTVSPPEGFVVSVDGDLPALFSYAAPLETVLRNLINNAIKHHDRAEGTIRIAAHEVGEMVEFSVADDGPGIDPAFHDRIFQMFQTLRPRDQVEGSGIGLAVVEKIVASVGGTIRLESSLERGATFYFTWPRQFKE